MYRTASVSCYDVMDEVFAHAVVKTYEDMGPGEPPSESTWSTTVQGTGSGSDSVWLRDALIGLIELL